MLILKGMVTLFKRLQEEHSLSPKFLSTSITKIELKLLNINRLEKYTYEQNTNLKSILKIRKKLNRS